MKFSENGQDKLLPALIAARRLFPPIVRGATAEVTMESGGRYSYTYAELGPSLELVKGPLLDNGLNLTFDPSIVPGTVRVVKEATATQEALSDETGRKVSVIALLEHESGQWRSAELVMPYARGKGMTVYQAIGSIITYGSRFLMMAILGLASVDQDAAGVEGEGEGEKGRNGAPPAGKEPIRPPQEKGKTDMPPTKEKEASKKEAPARAETTLIAPECLDSYESAKGMLSETVPVGDKEVPVFMPDEKGALTRRLKAAAKDLSAMTLLYAEVLNLYNAHVASIEGGDR